MTALEEKESYEKQWRENAASLASQNCYEWMASRLDGLKPRKILDIGCGGGDGIVALRERFRCTIVAIDENPCCLTRSAARLRALGMKVQLSERLIYIDQPDRRHVIATDTREIRLSREAMLVQGDILLQDASLDEFLASKAPFDAVTVWLIGTYGARTRCANLDSMKIGNSSTYRFAVQNKVYELAARVLRPGGVLHVVDRGEMPTCDDTIHEIIKSHRDQASVTDLQVHPPEFQTYTEATEGNRIPLEWTMADGTKAKGPAQSALISVQSVKP